MMGPRRKTSEGGLEIKMRTDFAPGQIIAERYVLEELLGIGGMGEVWAAKHRSLKKGVAIKLIRGRWFDDETIINRFIREARSAASIRGPHIVDVFDHGQDGHIVYIVMERLRGLSLRKIITSLRGPMPLADLRQILNQIMIGLGRAHDKGIIHRDIKPSNIFIIPHADGWHVKVVDFGLAKPTSLSDEESFELQTRQGVLLGTPAYMSPEQLSEGTSTIHSDLWAIAIMTFEMLCNCRPFSAEAPMSLLIKIATERPPLPSTVTEVPSGIDEWFAQATARDITDRFPHIRAMIKPLDQILIDEGDASSTVGVADILSEHLSPEDISLSVASLSHVRQEPPETEVFSTSSSVMDTVLEPSSSKSPVTSVKVAELQTQIQYRLMEQLRSEREKNQKLSARLAEKSEQDEQ